MPTSDETKSYKSQHVNSTPPVEAGTLSEAVIATRAKSWQRLVTSAKPRVLMITHGLGGGIERHVNDLARLLSPSCEVLVLRPAPSNMVCIDWARQGEDWRCWFSPSSEMAALVDCLKGVGVSRVHLHHIDGLPNAIWHIARELGVPLDITLHDHWPITKKYHLQSLVTGVQPELGQTEWHLEAGKLLAEASRVFAPSKYLTEQVNALHPSVRITWWPHPNEVAVNQAAQVKVAVIGRISPDKGLHVVVACAQYAKAHSLPLHFRIIGPTTEPIASFPELPLDATGGYNDADLAHLIALERPDVAFFPSQIPESFSYTLSAALNAGLPVVASRLGAFIERLDQQPNALLRPANTSPKDWCDALIGAAPPRVTARLIQSAPDQVADRNLAAYLSAIAAGQVSFPRAGDATPPLAGAYVAPKLVSTGHELTMADLYRYGIECGQSEARVELMRRASEADERLRANAEQIELEQSRRQQLEAELAHSVSEIGRERAISMQLQEELQTQSERLHAHIEKLEEELQTESERLHAHIEKLDQEIYENQQDALHALAVTRETLEYERDAARTAFAEISSSRFWRLTAPLRFASHQFKRLVGLGRDAAGQSKALPYKVSVARQILREEGPAALGRRLHEKYSRPSAEVRPQLPLYSQEATIEPLAVTASGSPDIASMVSIIIPVYGQHVMTYTCLKSIAATCAHLSIEVIVIDDCSTEPASVALAPVSGITVIRNDSNLGFLKNCNKAAAMARGEYVLILNNDVIVTPGWLDAMLATFSQSDNVGMVGAKLIYPDGKLQEAGGIVWRDGSAWNWGRNQDASRPEYNYLREVDYCSGACLLLKRADWEALGGFDERYAPAYYEDTDLAFRVREAGKRVYYQPAAVVVHFEGQSSGTDLTQGIKKHQVINQQTFMQRWRDVLAKHRINGVMPRLERDRYAKRRVMVVDACMLTPDQDSGSLRMFEMLGVMARMDAKVTFLADNLEFKEPYVSQIQALGVEVVYHPVESNVTRFLERHAAENEVIILSRATVAVKHIDTVKRVAPRAKVLFDTVDLHFLRQEREAELAGSTSQRLAALNMKEQELSIMHKSDATIVVSPVEQKLLADLAPTIRVSIVSNIHVNMPTPKQFADRRGAIFIGGFRHPPNLDAITWYAENVLPILRRERVGITTTVIGSNAPSSLQKFAAEDFVIAGFVSDVAPFYNDAKMSISPLRYGAGVKGKVNISMQYGVPVVATSPSVEGMYLKHGVDVLSADDAEGFAQAMILANNDQTLWEQLRANGLANIDVHFSRRTAGATLATLLEISPS
jgi:GT2 family glycosyltransferase/glycosyltransferase involved in cell wall biosynthesis